MVHKPSALPAALAASLQALEVQPVLLQVARHVLASQTFHVHELHDRLRDSVFDAEMRDGVDEALVQRRGPHETRALERVRRIVLGACVGVNGVIRQR